MHLATTNSNGKIWLFTYHDIEATIIRDTDQQLTVKLVNQTLAQSFYATIVYVKCEVDQRLSLWEDIYSISNDMDRPWLIRGDFNVILNDKEKIGGLPIQDADHEDFDYCIETCDLTRVNFQGSPFTWWNGRAENDCIFKRLDRILFNPQMLS